MSEFMNNLIMGIVIVLSVGYVFNFVNVKENEKTSEPTQIIEETVAEPDNPEKDTVLQHKVVEVVTKNETPVTNETERILENLINKMSAKDSRNEEKTSEPVTQEPVVSFSNINTMSREALVNIVCTIKSGGKLSPISGSGIIVDPRGLILTNAHVAQYYLLRDYAKKEFIDCVIRTGSPARITYRAEPVYISEKWIVNNASQLVATNPTGTGQDAFAILAITESAIIGQELPKTFPFVSVTSGTQLDAGQNVFIGGYPAGFLSGQIIQSDLNITSTVSQISQIYTFGMGTVDFITVDGSILSQKGASGGAVINDKSNVIGLIVTSTEADSTADRILGVITTGHINISLLQQTGEGLAQIFSRDINKMLETFKTKTAPPLREVLFGALN